MKETKFTPGPWKADIRGGCYSVYPANESHNCLAESPDNEIARQLGRGEPEREGMFQPLTEEQIANAQLIGVAPEMYVLLIKAESYLSMLGTLHPTLKGIDMQILDDSCVTLRGLCHDIQKLLDKAKGKDQ